MSEQEFFEKMKTVWLQIDITRHAIVDLTSQIKALEEKGITNATIHTRADNGGMELIHPTGSEYERQTGRRREYIGKKPGMQDAAIHRVRRWKEHKELRSQLRQQESRLAEIERKVSMLEMTALGKQTRLFSELGTAGQLVRDPAVPNNFDWLTPQMVIDYFHKSPILAGMADDVETVLKPLAVEAIAA